MSSQKGALGRALNKQEAIASSAEPFLDEDESIMSEMTEQTSEPIRPPEQRSIPASLLRKISAENSTLEEVDNEDESTRHARQVHKLRLPKPATPPPLPEPKLDDKDELPRTISDENETEDMESLKADLKRSLEEEQSLINLQMQLNVQLEKIKIAIQEAESEERLARLALQHAKVTRLLEKGSAEVGPDDGVITIELRT